MKHKKFTYFLVFLVLVVWGIISYRVIASSAGEEDRVLPLTLRKINKEPYNDDRVPADTARLRLNYKDPFALNKPAGSAVPAPALTKSLPMPAKIAFNWNFVRYSGYIRNAGSKKLLAVVTIDGKTRTMTEGETSGQVRLVKNLQDSIKISYKGEMKFIKMQSGAL